MGPVILRSIMMAMLLVGSLAADAAEPADLIPLPIVLPVGGQRASIDYWRRTPSLPQKLHGEYFSDKPSPSLPLVPRDVRNLALRRPVTSSDNEPVIGELAMVTDGIKSEGPDAFLELGPGGQWVQIDLGRMAEIHAIVVWHFLSDIRIYRGVVVQVADDAASTANLRTLFNNDAENGNRQGVGADGRYPDTFRGKVIPAKGTTARFVRCWSRGSDRNDLNQYVEVEVWGR